MAKQPSSPCVQSVQLVRNLCDEPDIPSIILLHFAHLTTIILLLYLRDLMLVGSRPIYCIQSRSFRMLLFKSYVPSVLFFLSQHYPQEIEVLLQTKKVVIGKTDNLPPDGSNEDFDEQTVQWIKGFIGQDGDPTEPINVFYYPILADANMQVKNTGNLNDELQGVLVLTGFWREFVKDILVSMRF